MNLSEIKTRVDLLAEKIGAPQDILPTYGYSNHTARPHINVDSDGYHYVIAERGQELERLTTSNLDELLYTIFADVTFSLSSTYELAHRMENQDCREIIFHHQIELLTLLSLQWGERKSQEHEQILKQYPYDDFANTRAALCKKLMDQGVPSEAAWKMACAKYPLSEGRNVNKIRHKRKHNEQ